MPFVAPQTGAQVPYQLEGMAAELRAPIALDPSWYAAALTSEARIVDGIARLRDGRACLRLLQGVEREVAVGDELCAISPVPACEGAASTVAARRGGAAFDALVRHVHEGTIDDARAAVAGYLA